MPSRLTCRRLSVALIFLTWAAAALSAQQATPAAPQPGQAATKPGSPRGSIITSDAVK